MDDTSKKPQTFRALAAELKLPRKLLYTLDEVSRVLGVPYNTLERLVHLRFPSKEVPMGFILALSFAFLFGVGLGLMRR